MFTFAINLAVIQLVGESWLDRMGTNSGQVVTVALGSVTSDWQAFLLQVVALVLATGVPIWASRVYVDRTSVQLGRETVLYSVRGKKVFKINQATCVIEPCRETRFLWPRTLWLPIIVVRPGGGNVLVNMKWRARGFRKESRYVYRYAEIQQENGLAIAGTVHWGVRASAKARSIVNGAKLVPPEQAVVDVVEPSPKAGAEEEFPYLSVHGVPPYVPSNLMPFPTK